MGHGVKGGGPKGPGATETAPEAEVDEALEEAAVPVLRLERRVAGVEVLTADAVGSRDIATGNAPAPAAPAPEDPERGGAPVEILTAETPAEGRGKPLTGAGPLRVAR